MELEVVSPIDKELSIEENFFRLLNLMERTNSIIFNKDFSIETLFFFPEDFKTACEQYLLYFATFLKDLGIEAKTDIENQENGILFKVFPKDKETALTQIKEALDVYLDLPKQQNIDQVGSQFPDAAVQQLISNIYHLKSQLVLANSTILKLQKLQNEKETSELFQYQNKPIIHLKEHKAKNEEKIFGGIVTVKEYDGNGFKIDLPKLFRILKRVWKK